ncbi:MAG: restriction endonuclease subunit S [Nitrospiraceae bacterium]|nr:MAG: restriction endonuclease subunit S [Nitrospiraceae bacterium]
MSRWPQKPLLEVARLTRGTEPGSVSYTDSSRGVRFLRVGDITGKTNNPVYTDAARPVLVTETDVLLAIDGSPGYVSTGHRGAISSGLRKVEPIDPNKVSLDWLRYSLMSPDIQHTICKYTNGVTILHASSAIPHVSIPIPPLSEQKRIVALLDEADQLR